VIERAKRGGFNPIVCTTAEAADDVVAAIAASHGARCYRGSVEDKLERWRGACETFKLIDFHTVDADDPFFDPGLCHASLTLLRSHHYDLVYPATTTYLASVGYSLTRSIVERACALKTTTDTEMMWYHVEKVPGLRTAELTVPDGRAREVRLTLDYEEDYWLLRSVLRILGPDARRVAIEELFLRNPQLTSVNWFRNDAWKTAQEAKRV
jgi:spore coat polysaccharide biosynthesis protein SpsF